MKLTINNKGLKYGKSAKPTTIRQFNPHVSAQQYQQLNRAAKRYVKQINKSNQKAFKSQLTENRKAARENLIAKYSTINNAIMQYAPALHSNSSLMTNPGNQSETTASDSESTNVMKFVK